MCSCANDKEQSDVCIINVDCKKQLEKEKVDIENYCSKRKFISLETTEASLFTKINRLIFHDNKIIIFDKKLGAVLIFDDTGKFLKKIMNIGKGPNEWVQLIDMTLYKNEIVMHCAIPEKLVYYNLDGDYLRMEKHEYEDIYISSINNSLVYAGHACDKRRDENYIKVDNGTKVKEYMPIEDYMILNHFYGARPSLLKSSELFFFKSWDSFIYKVNEQGCFPVYRVSLKGKKFIEGTELNSPSLEKFGKNKSNLTKINDFRDSKSYATFTMWPYHRIILYDKEQKTASVVKSFYDNEIGIPLISSFYVGHDGGDEQIVFAFQAIAFINIINRNEQLDNKYQKIADDLTPNDNPIIIVYDYKQ